VDLQLFIDRLLESENLTDNLDDEAANTLLKWGISQIDHLVKDKDEETAGSKVNQLMSLMRSVNSMAGNPSTASTQSLFNLLDIFAQTFGKNHFIGDKERRAVVQQISGMEPKDAVDYLLTWMDSKQ
jgi:hypothetical protein